jgi:chorismate synthase
MQSMSRLRFLTAGESHGPMLTGILDGAPSGVALSAADFSTQLKRRRDRYGRSERQQTEDDVVRVVGGIRHNKTTGAPIALLIDNKVSVTDDKNWPALLAPFVDGEASPRKVTLPRPGHADAAGVTKYDLDDVRDVLERASARETAMRVALSVVPRQLLAACGITVSSAVVAIGDVVGDATALTHARTRDAFLLAAQHADADAVRSIDRTASVRMHAAIDAARAAGETLGGTSVVVVHGAPVGLGSHVQWDRRLSTSIAAALSSVQSVKSVSIGDNTGAVVGSAAHDAFSTDGTRLSNHSGGIEGGISNGENIVAVVTQKPLSTLPRGLPSRDIATGAIGAGHSERSDVCVVPAGSVVLEAMMCFAIADALLDRFGGDSMQQLLSRVHA